jgi:hypothetical protein
LALGCIQLVQIVELYIKLRYILNQKNLVEFNKTQRKIFAAAAIAIFLSLIALPYFNVRSVKIYDSIDYYKLYTEDSYKQAEKS